MNPTAMSSITWKEAPSERKPVPLEGGMKYLIGGKVHSWTGPGMEVRSPLYQTTPEGRASPLLGKCGLLDSKTSLEALEAASRAYDKGRGLWPKATVTFRLQCMEKFLNRMEKRRIEVARLICWEIGKSWADSLKEFDRTVAYGRETMTALKELDRKSTPFIFDSGFLAQIRRAPIGVALCMGPYNYPLNEAFATLLPALIMGNTVVVKLPRLGMLCNMPLMEDFAEAFPPGVINIITGEGSHVVTPVIEDGRVDLLAFIGSANTASNLKHLHPSPNRLRSVLGLGAKNAAIVLPDAEIEVAVKECVQGALTFNGQRCTALKMLFVDRSVVEEFTELLATAVDALPRGMAFEDGVTLTPLPDLASVAKMHALVADALDNGAEIKNPLGGKSDQTWFHPAVLYPVTEKMRIWHEEQFGPIVPIAVYDDPDEFLDYVAASPYGQQASIFGTDPQAMGALIDALVNQVSRVNLNSQCQRGPDTFPFVGRKNSAEGTLSIADALKIFSIRSLVATKNIPDNTHVIQRIIRERTSRFLNTDYLF